MPSTPATDADQDDVDDDRVPTDADELPERFVAAEEFFASVRARDPDHVDVDALAKQLSKADVVDVDEATDESVQPYTFEELTDYV
jgi:hypothetical protein